MKLTEEGVLVTSGRVVSFLRANPRLLAAAEEHLEAFVSVCEKLSSERPTAEDVVGALQGLLASSLGEFSRSIEKSLGARLGQGLDQVDSRVAFVARALEQATLDVEKLSEKLANRVGDGLTSKVVAGVASEQKLSGCDLKLFLQEQVADLRSVSDKVSDKLSLVFSEVSGSSRKSLSDLDAFRNSLDKLERSVFLSKNTPKSLRAKCEEGEASLFEFLAERLMERDGYQVEMTSSQPRACDILITRKGFPDVRVECKAHGADSSEKVRTKEVLKFRRDLEAQGCHGLFVSLNSGIVGKGTVDLEQLGDGRLAFYVSHAAPNLEVVVDVLGVLYKLDGVLELRKAGEHSTGLSQKDLQRVRHRLAEFSDRFTSARESLRNFSRHFEELHQTYLKDLLESLSCSAPPLLEAVEEVASAKRPCPNCGRLCVAGTGLASHLRHCSSARAEVELVERAS